MNQDFISDYSETVQQLAIHTEALIEKTISGIQSIVDSSAKIIGYGFGNGYKDTICTIIFSKKEIKLGFYKGAALPDPSGILSGSGKVHKYVPIKSNADISDTLKQLIIEAHKAYLQRQSISS